METTFKYKNMSVEEKNKRDIYRNSRLWNLTSTVSLSEEIVRVRCVSGFDKEGNKVGHTCVEFKASQGMTEGNLFCRRFVRDSEQEEARTV